MRSLSAFFGALARFDVAEYRRRVDRMGRARLAEDGALVAEVGSLAEAAVREWRRSGRHRDRRRRNVIAVASRFFAAQDYILRHARPRYEPYTGVPLLRHVLARRSVAASRRQTWIIFREILRAQIDFEAAALAGRAPPKIQFDPDVGRARIEALHQVWSSMPDELGQGGPGTIQPVEHSRLDHIAHDPTGIGVVQNLLVFPQTMCHDEVAFIRLILLAECLFQGTLLLVERALRRFGLGDLPGSIRLVRAATDLTAPLIKVFHAVRTMPPAHFHGFRAATGDASAVQSRSWQLLDAHVYGVLPEKVPVLERTPEVRCVLELAGPDFLPLVQVVGKLGRSGADAELRDAIIALDRRLRAWRKFHERQLAGRTDAPYLPPHALGTGGTLGLRYLAAQRAPRASRIPGRPERDPS